MAKQCIVNRNSEGDITSVVLENFDIEKDSVLEDLSSRNNVLLTNDGLLINNNSRISDQNYKDLSLIASATGMTLATTSDKNYKIYTDLLTNTIYLNNDTEILDSDITKMVNTLKEKFDTKSLEGIDVRIRENRDKFDFKKSRELEFTLDRKEVPSMIIQELTGTSDYIELIDSKGNNQIYYSIDDYYENDNLSDLIGDKLTLKIYNIGFKASDGNFNKVGQVGISDKVKHSLTAYNNRTMDEVFSYWDDVWSNNKVLTESATTKMDKIDDRIYIEMSDNTPYMGVSPYDNYSIVTDSVNPVLNNVKYITRSTIESEPEAVKEIVDNAKDYEEWLITVSPANIERIIFKDKGEAERFGRPLNEKWGIETVLEEQKPIGTLQFGESEVLDVYDYTKGVVLKDSKGAEYKVRHRIGDDSYVLMSGMAIIELLTKEEYYTDYIGTLEKMRENSIPDSDRQVLYPRKLSQNSLMFQNQSQNNSLETPREVLQAVTDRLLEKGLVNGINILSSKDLQIVLEDLGVSKNISKQVIAWHGSPHSFDRFTTDAIGTGEGAQAFGWGLYFTDLKGIAENYATVLSTKDQEFLLNGEGEEILRHAVINNLTNDNVESILESFYNLYPSRKPLSEEEEKDIYGDYYNEYINYRKLQEKTLLERKNEKFDLGSKNLYNVTLHKGKNLNNYTWLDWDKNFSNKNIINNINNSIEFTSEEKKSLIDSIMEDGFDSGGAFYNTLTNMLGSQKIASLFLLESGIDGIKYPAESLSRGATSDNARGFNYVVFDENAITIEEQIRFQKELEKNGLKLMINGFYNSKNGEIYINSEGTNILETTIHEFAHPMLQWLRTNKPSHYKAGVELLQKNPEEAKPYIDFVQETQPDLDVNSEEFQEEVLAQIVGDNGAKLIDSSKKSNIIEWLTELWENVKNILNITQYTPDEISRMTLQEFAQAVTSEMLNSETAEQKNIDNIFENNSSLSSIGTKEQYLEYLNNIFPDSKTKDIVYHFTDAEFDEFGKNHIDVEGNIRDNLGYYFIEESATEGYKKIFGKNEKPAILNIKNPLIVQYDYINNETSTSYKLEYLTPDFKNEFIEQGYDGGIIEREGETEYIVFESEQIHILGSKKDLEYFKNFVKNNTFFQIMQNTQIPSQLYEQLKQQPFLNQDQALEAYKNIYSKDMQGWENSELDC